jgi:hypothetical protein
MMDLKFSEFVEILPKSAGQSSKDGDGPTSAIVSLKVNDLISTSKQIEISRICDTVLINKWITLVSGERRWTVKRQSRSASQNRILWFESAARRNIR